MAAAGEAAPKKSTKLLDKYVLGKLLGQGAFGVVYKCRRKGTTNDYAVKMIDQVETPLNEIEKEVQMLQVLKHPTVIALHEVFYEKVFVCMVLELYKGGDMIQGMMAHWKKKGMIPMTAVRHLTKQMWDSIAFLHARNFVHRDVKGDNFMMDLNEVEHPDNRIYLSDFGTVVELKAGERKTQKCGTKNYWSPEFFKQNYAHKVDCWAVGVIMFGFFSGKFPFKNEQEVNNKKLQMHTRVGPEGEDLLMMAFARDEKKRCEAAEASKHVFVGGGAVTDKPEQNDPNFTPDFNDRGADAGIKARRQELVDRLVKNAKQFQDNLEGGTTPGLPKQQSGSVYHRGNSIIVETIGEDSFSIQDKNTDRSMVFKWTKADDAKNLTQQIESAPSIRTASVNNDVSNQNIQNQLKVQNIDLSQFGTGKAKTVQDFIDEIQMGKARLLIDATRAKGSSKFLVRGVDAVLLRVFVKTPQGKKYCIEKQEKFPDGRVRESGRLPGSARAPHENASQAAGRLVEELMKMQDAGVMFDFSHIDRQEQGEESPSYPGVHTVYIKQTVTGVATVTDAAVLKRIGLGEGGSGTFEVEDSSRYSRVFEWMTEEECTAKGILLRPRQEEGDYSALVYPPVGLNEEDLFQYLTDNNVDVTKWGEGTARSVAEFSEELVKGESALLRQDSGRIVRVVDIVVLKLVKTHADGSTLVLREVEEKVSSKASTLDRLPATKRRADEHPFAAARRMISKHLHMDNNTVTLDPDDVKVSQEEQESTSYPGLLSIYRKRYMQAMVNDFVATSVDSTA